MEILGINILDTTNVSIAGVGVVGTLVLIYGVPQVVKGLQGIVNYCNKLIGKLTGKK